jgi:hypothetical protein
VSQSGHPEWQVCRSRNSRSRMALPSTFDARDGKSPGSNPAGSHLAGRERLEIQEALGLRHEDYFRAAYPVPALEPVM